ncbi:D-alanyl-D-alanine carboxypeptidase family protein [Desulfovibrio intestinalis]|uniref:D-alanyl-D-alanine carboxypeptidase (Penicillin-binding protein 5/6) n=1 Tax=Desulfovibrio intestinalis TaxID=58621 RepID=A0A7W8FF23_9BACT|nr:D-alanyl-D-alanine carboxypeptidase family protein [Desulfovibrio intestinalis]MBB5144379.1 D-alanyl-D-alanine carboxypeptidase (penicillin-binding protein 5/6) [Desulfovibrio intestinalis]
MTCFFRRLKYSALSSSLPLFFILLAAALLHPGVARSAPEIPPHGSLETSSAILYDLDHNAILFEQNADKHIAPASLTKVLSMFLAMDQIRQGSVSLDSPVTVSRAAARTGGSRMGLSEKDNVTLEQLLMGMAVSSGNDASAAVAEFVGGSTPAFVTMMNAKAQALGMRDSQFRNPHGLPAAGQYTTARDMLTLARAYLQTYPDALRFHNTHTISHKGRVTWNKNPLLGQYPGADGLKTGWVNASGYNLIFTASHGDKRLLAVILGAPDSRTRGVEAFRLLDAGFQVCDNRAASVVAALDCLPPEQYRPDMHKTAREARLTYGGANDAPVKKITKAKKAQNNKSKQTAKAKQQPKKKEAAKAGGKQKRDSDQAARRTVDRAS